MLKSILWNVIGNSSFLALGFIISILMARNIDPIYFGHFILIISIPSIINSILYYSYKNYCIQNRNDLSLISSIRYHFLCINISIYGSIICGVLLYGLFSHKLGIYPKSIILICLAQILYSLCAPQLIKLELTDGFKVISFAKFLAQCLSGIIGVYWAFHGGTIEALALRYSSHFAFLSIGFLVLFGSFSIKRNKIEIYETIKSLGIYQALNLLTKHIDDYIIGFFIGSNILGQYGKAYQIFIMPSEQFEEKVSDVIIPQISAGPIENSQSKILRYQILSKLFLFPFLMFLALDSKEIIESLLGPKWETTGELLPWFAIATMVSFDGYIKNLCIILKKNITLRKWGILKFVLSTLGIIVGALISITALVQIFALVCLILSIIGLFMSKTKYERPIMTLFKLLALPITVAVLINITAFFLPLGEGMIWHFKFLWILFLSTFTSLLYYYFCLNQNLDKTHNT